MPNKYNRKNITTLKECNEKNPVYCCIDKPFFCLKVYFLNIIEIQNIRKLNIFNLYYLLLKEKWNWHAEDVFIL